MSHSCLKPMQVSVTSSSLFWLARYLTHCSAASQPVPGYTPQCVHSNRSVQLPRIHPPAESSMCGHTAGGRSHLRKGAAEGGPKPKEFPTEISLQMQLLSCQVTGLARHVPGTQVQVEYEELQRFEVNYLQTGDYKVLLSQS